MVRAHLTALWAAAVSISWVLGWLITANVTVDAANGYVAFGSSGALVATAITGLVLRRILGAGQRPTARASSATRTVNATVSAAVLLILLPVALNAAFAALAAKFDYPDTIRRPTAEVLEQFRQDGPALVLLWWAFAMTAVLLAPLALLLAGALDGAHPLLLSLGSTVGVLAALVQVLGLIRWPFLVPHLARVAGEPDAPEARKEAVDLLFQSFNRYLGMAVGEHLGYLFTGTWSILVGAAIM